MKKAINSQIRYVINKASRFVLPEAYRKILVAKYYNFAAWKQNLSLRESPASDADVILEGDELLKYRYSFSRNLYRGNSLYGTAHVIETYAGHIGDVKACIEHGVYFGNYVNPSELDQSGLPALVTFGPARCAHVRAVSDVPLCPIGPYIHYANPLLNDREFSTIKNLIGKTLLVFPSHSVDRVRVDYAVAAFCDEIDRVRVDYDMETVLVSLYYRDFEMPAYHEYVKRGYRIVCAGYREDKSFLMRLKSLIMLADLTMSNNVGTHVGYCFALDKPHKIFMQDKIHHSDSAKDDVEFINEFSSTQELEKKDVAKAFWDFENCDNALQRNVCQKYWGVDFVRSKSEIRTLLNLLDSVYSYRPRLRQAALKKALESEANSDARELFWLG